ncbi:hypothetical protein DPEC_G00025320 [Dallia pectoralis]|uniref:Uncharacterized protein n=1 Tax=Dallia pectoralis TaxID=75939 RepID=A0ACC2HHY9_DALPE|nr:hypothetical protein DPEC_G00025320 [Dallia pectoralis]
MVTAPSNNSLGFLLRQNLMAKMTMMKVRKNVDTATSAMIRREISRGDGDRTVKQQSGLSPVAKPHGQDDNNEGEEKRGHGHQPDDQVRGEFGITVIRS